MSSHKPGSLKQSNKKHKGSAGKRAQNRSFGEGRVASQSATTRTAPNRANNPTNDRLNRINHNNQVKKQKNAANWLQKRIGTAQSSSKLISVIALSDAASIVTCLESCLQQSSWNGNGDDISSSSLINAYYGTYKTKLTYLLGHSRDIFKSVELTKLADIILFVVCGSEDGSADLIDKLGFETLTAIRALGCPEVIVAATGLDGTTSKANLSLKKFTQQYLDQNLAIPDAKLVECSSITHLQRALCVTTPKPVNWRATRSYIVSETVKINPQQLQQQEQQLYRVQVSGYLRGAPMYLNSLMHVVDVGTGRLVAAWGASDEERHALQRSLNNKQASGQQKHPNAGLAMNGEIVVPVEAVLSNPELQDSLVMEATADSLMGEQTWPSEAELAGDFDGTDGDVTAGRNRRAVTSKVIPKGMSSYQADWFQDEEGNVDFNATVLDSEEAENGEADPIIEDDDEEGADDSEEMQKLAAEDEAAAKQKQMMRAAAAQGDKEFPDEVDTPGDVSARQRFARYRALQSFRASPWHPKENLPQDYAKIFEFENFMGTQRRVLNESRAVEALCDRSDLRVKQSSSSSSVKKARSTSISAAQAEVAMETSDNEEEVEESAMEEQQQSESSLLMVCGAEDFIKPGQLVHFVLESVPADVLQKYQQTGFLSLFNLFQHENKLSVLHFSVQRTADHADLIIKSKDPLLFQAGFRSYMTKPLFSESNLNCDKHKMERFLLGDRFSMASSFGPISYSPCPLLMFRRCPDTQRFVLVATGSLSSVDPDRIMLKRIILTGLPIRVRKKMGVVKHMFFDSQDVRWFKPAELSTKFGLRGHIKEPIGTHGLLKAYFSAPIKQNDTVMLVLYKRVYPKFPSEGLVVK